MRSLLVRVSVLFALLGVLGAQDLAWRHTAVVDVYRVSSFSAAFGDTDRDGFVDVAWEGQARSVDGRPLAYVIAVCSGRDGRMLRYWGVPTGQNVTRLSAFGDLDEDGIGDYGMRIKMNSGIDRVEARSGADDRVLWRMDRDSSTAFGASLGGGLDVDGDGHLEVVVTHPRAGPNGSVVVIDRFGRLVRQIAGTPSLAIGAQFGRCIDVVGDVDGDGGEDFVVSGFDRTGTYGRGCGVVISGKTGRVLSVGYDQQPGDGIGDAVAGIGDINGDGVPDFAAGALGTSNQRPGVIRAFSGRDGSPLFTWRGNDYQGYFEGLALSGGHDVDRDGVPDIVQSNATRLRALSGRDGKLLMSVYHYWDLGFFHTVVPATASDPFPRLVSPEPDYGYSRFLQKIGRVHAYRAVPPTTRVFGQPCALASTTPKIGCRNLFNRDHSAVVGTRVTVFDAPAGAPTVLVLGQSDRHYLGRLLPWSLRDLGLPRCSLLVSSELILPARTGTAGIDAGFASVDLPRPASTTGKLELFAQWLVLDPPGSKLHSVSDALSVRINP